MGDEGHVPEFLGSHELLKFRLGGLNETLFHKDPVAQNVFFKIIHQFYMGEEFCDVTLKTNGGHIRAHRVVLAAACHYFRGKFSFSANELEIPVPFDKENIVNLLRFIYTGEMILNEDNVFEMMAVQDYFQVGIMRSLICNFLLKAIEINNVWSIMRESEYYRYIDVFNASQDFISWNFSKLISEPTFMDVPFDLFSKVLEFEELAVPREDDLVFHFCRWLSHNEHRSQFLLELLSKIDVMGITEWNITKDKVLELFVGDVKEAVEKWFEEAAERRRNGQPKKVNRYKEDHAYMLISIGGTSTDGCRQPAVDCTTSLVEYWKPMMLTCKGKYPDYEFQRVIPIMNVPRKLPAVTSTYKEIYVLGGTELNYEVEMYSVSENKWTALPDFPDSFAMEPSITVLDGNLYATGGKRFESDGGGCEFSNECFALYPGMPSWKKLSNMNNGRACHFLLTIANHIYCLGGYGSEEHIALEIERFDPVTNLWHTVTRFPVRANLVSCSVDGTSIVAYFGKFIFWYDTVTNAWTNKYGGRCGLHMRFNRPVEPFVRNYCVDLGAKLIMSAEEPYNLLEFNFSSKVSNKRLSQHRPWSALSMIRVSQHKAPSL